MRRILSLLAVLLLAGCATRRCAPPPPTELASPARCLLVTAGDARGTAFVVGRRVLTAWHVVVKTNGHAVVSARGVSLAVEFRQAESLDMGTADAPDPVPPGWGVYEGAAEPHVGDRLDSYGYMGDEGDFAHYRGRVIGTVTFKGDAGRYLTIDCPVQRGMSGGPVVNERGEVVAILSAKMDEKTVALVVP